MLDILFQTVHYLVIYQEKSHNSPLLLLITLYFYKYITKKSDIKKLYIKNYLIRIKNFFKIFHTI